jgi:hypothetical protein
LHVGGLKNSREQNYKAPRLAVRPIPQLLVNAVTGKVDLAEKHLSGNATIGI